MEDFAKMEIGWVLSVTHPTKEQAKKGSPIIVYGNDYYKDNLYAVIGLKEDNNIYTSLDSYSTFIYKNGETMEESIKLYFQENYQVPEKKKKKKYTWKVFAYVIVEKDGSLSDITINKGVSAEIDSSIVDLLKNMPPWTPATKGNEKVRSKTLLGVYFEWFNKE